MRVAGIVGKQRRRFRRTTDSRHAFAIAPNRLGRDFTAAVSTIIRNSPVFDM